MREVFEGDHSLNYGADDEHYIVYPKVKILSELYKKKNTTAEKQKEKVEDEKGEKQVSVSTYHDMIDDVSQKLKIGFEQYIMAKEGEISKLKKELAKEKSISDSLLSNNLQLVQDLDEAKEENKDLSQSLDKVQAGYRQLSHSLREVQSEKQQLTQNLDEVKAKNKQLTHDSEATQAENRQLAYKLYQAQESNKQLAQNLNQAQKSKSQLAHDLDEAQKENQQLAHDLGEAQTKSKELARGQGEAMAECSMLEFKLEEAQAENQKLSKKLDEARDEISCKDITIRRMKKDAERKDTAMQADVSEVKEKIAREMIDSGIRFVKDMKTAIDDSQTFKCMGLLNHMTDDCFGKHESIHRELKDMIQGIFGSREQVAKEQNEPRPNNVTVEKGGVYNAEVHHQDIHHEVDQPDFLPKGYHPLSLSEVDQLISLPRHKRKRLGLEGEDYEWK
jgi:predicted nuclease with TOPRIM domain